ncbi:MAG: TonB family protein [Sphingopyxis sp.]
MRIRLKRRVSQMMVRLLTMIFGLSAALPATAQTAPPPAAPAPATPARALGDPAQWVSLSDYPAAAYNAQAEGAVRVRLSIAPLGFVDGCSIVESSGNTALDEGTCAILRVRAFFTPARDAAGNAIATTQTRRIVWRHPVLHPEVVAPPAPTPVPVPAP